MDKDLVTAQEVLDDIFTRSYYEIGASVRGIAKCIKDTRSDTVIEILSLIESQAVLYDNPRVVEQLIEEIERRFP